MISAGNKQAIEAAGPDDTTGSAGYPTSIYTSRAVCSLSGTHP